MAAAPGILLKAFSLFPAICSAPPGPGHVDNLFVEGKGAKSAGERRKCHYLLSRLSAARPFRRQLQWGRPILPPPFWRLGEQGSARVQLGRPGGGEGRILWGPDSQRPQTHTCSGGGSPSSFVQTLVWTGVWLGPPAVLILACVGAGQARGALRMQIERWLLGSPGWGGEAGCWEVVTGGPTPLQLPAV